MAQNTTQNYLKVCKICDDYRRKEDERSKRVELRDECCWNSHNKK